MKLLYFGWLYAVPEYHVRPRASVNVPGANPTLDVPVPGSSAARGATGLRGAFLGSIAAGVLSKTQRPLLSIPKRAVAGDAKNAVFATDFRFKPDERSLAVLREMMTLRKSKLHIVHIMDKPGEYRDTVQEQALSQKLAGIPHDFHYLHDRDIAQAVSNFIESTDAGTLIAIAHEHSLLHRLFFDSITRRLAHRIHVPMLTLHDAGN